jgi:hypothetical protein
MPFDAYGHHNLNHPITDVLRRWLELCGSDLSVAVLRR